MEASTRLTSFIPSEIINPVNNFYSVIKIMSYKRSQGRSIQKKRLPNNREGDWICQMCGNYNYSFRLNCNRCQVQTKELNNALTIYYDEQSYYISEVSPSRPYQPQQIYWWDQHEEEPFPKVVFLIIDHSPWDPNRDESQQRRDATELQNVLWIDQLIKD